MIRIITDSAADMEKAELEKYSVTSVPPVSYTHLFENFCPVFIGFHNPTS